MTDREEGRRRGSGEGLPRHSRKRDACMSRTTAWALAILFLVAWAMMSADPSAGMADTSTSYYQEE